MFKNYIKIALRNIKNHKSYSLINVLGLAIGLSIVILIMIWVQHELSFDRHYLNADHIYRVVFEDKSYDNVRHYSVTPPALAAGLSKDYPEITYAATFYSRSGILVNYEENLLKERLAYSNSSLFDIFSFEFISGNPQTALINPYSIILTEETAVKYFGDENPISKTLALESKTDFIVTAVIKNLPENGTLQFDALTDFEHLYEMSGRGKSDSWDSFGYNTFVMLTPETNIDELNQKISDYIIKRNSDDTFKPVLYLQSLLDIHLYNLNGGGIIIYVYIFSFIALFLLVLACINFINLVTARSALRIKEISLRKVIGANRKNLIFQFLGESILLTILSLAISLIFVDRLLPVFNELTHQNLSFSTVLTPSGIILIVIITLFTGILAGSYPALYLSGFKPIAILKNHKLSGSSLLRNFLVVFQFSISVIMIISTMVVLNQLTYVENQNLGFNSDHVVYIPLNSNLNAKVSSIKYELKSNPQIHDVTATSNKIGINSFHSVDLKKWEGNTQNKSILLGLIYTDYDFLQTFDIEMSEGRFYSKDFVSDSFGVVINQAAVEEMGMVNPIGKKIFEKSHIIGVIKDFNYQSLHSGIGPLAIGMNPRWNRYLAIKVQSENIEETISYIESVLKKYAPDNLFDYYFLDHEFEKLYQSEKQLGRIFLYFSILAIFISSLGLFGLASFMVERRTKEIGVRKVLGASVSKIFLLLSKEFTIWILISNLIAWPISWYIMNLWLNNFAYKTTLDWWLFMIAGFITGMIALISTCSQTIKLALSNPIRALRYE